MSFLESVHSVAVMSSKYILPSANSVITFTARRVNKECNGRSVTRWMLHHSHSRSLRTMASNTKHEGSLLTLDNLNPCIKVMEYAVRGPLVVRAAVIEKELEKGVPKPFDEVIRANIGDCHAMGQTPITFIRQVLAVVSYPSLLSDPSFPDDVKERAELLLSGCKGGSAGSYTDSPGIEIIRRHIAEYIERRDGFPSTWEDIVLCAGASDGIKTVLKMLICDICGLKPGIMVPIPQYPLYSATIAEFNMHQVGYYLDESKEWGLTIGELTRALEEVKGICSPRALVVINPGNPTGQVLTKQNIQEIIKFAYDNNLILMADEVYQHNVYDKNSEFHSFKKVLMEMGLPYNKTELASFMSCSKGYMGECGLRGGYAEVINLDPDVKAMFMKSISAMLCPTVLGQITMDCVVKPPEPGQASYELYSKEKKAVLESLAERAKMVADTFNSIEGISCNAVQGAMYAFPQIKIPAKAVELATELHQCPDVYYAFQLLESTGICIVPGSGFGQKGGTYHFRTTILPQSEKLKKMLEKFRVFHEQFVEKHQ